MLVFLNISIIRLSELQTKTSETVTECKAVAGGKHDNNPRQHYVTHKKFEANHDNKFS